MGDLIVVGLVAPAHFIEDIEVEVLKGVETTIPGSLCLRSKDFHDALAGHQIAVLRTSVSRAPSVVEDSSGLKAEMQRLTLQNQALSERNAVLEAQVEYLHQGLAALQEKLETSLVPLAEEVPEGGPTPQVKGKTFRKGGRP